MWSVSQWSYWPQSLMITDHFDCAHCGLGGWPLFTLEAWDSFWATPESSISHFWSYLSGLSRFPWSGINSEHLLSVQLGNPVQGINSEQQLFTHLEAWDSFWATPESSISHFCLYLEWTLGFSTRLPWSGINSEHLVGVQFRNPVAGN